MGGFTAIISKNRNIPQNLSFRKKNIYSHEKNFIDKTILNESFAIRQFTNPKFPDDKVFEQDEDFVIGIEGVILNLQQLRKKTDTFNSFDIIKKLYIENGEMFIRDLKGDFSGFIFDKQKNRWFIFTNPTNSKSIFYLDAADYFIFASELKDISYLMSDLSIKKNLNIPAAYMLLAYGYMLADYTLVDDVKRLQTGNLLSFDGNDVSSTEYFYFGNIPQNSDTKEQIIEKMDTLFSNAVRLEFEKDKEYGYSHYATLSGGLDSRMTILIANKLGYKDQLNFTFSQSNYLDEIIAKEITNDYHHGFLFYSLNNGNHLKAIDQTIYYSDGLVTYRALSHTLKMLETMNHDQYGLVHTGMLGDAVIGSYLSKPYPIPASMSMGAFSKKTISEITTLYPEITGVMEDIIKKYPTEELFKLYGRGFLGILAGNANFDIYSQVSSPFLDLDFLMYCYSIPEKYKYNYRSNIYLDWIAAKHPDFNKYRWEKTGMPPLKSNSYSKYFNANYYRRMSLKFFDLLSKKENSGMNPFDYWLSNNTELAKYIDEYFTQHIYLLNDYPKLRKDCEHIFKTGSANDKFPLLTLLAAIKLHFI